VKRVNRAVFLDRDGTINEMVYLEDFGLIDSPMNPEQFRLIAGAGEAIRRLNQLGLKVVLVSNQPGIAKGKTTPELFEQVRKKMRELLTEEGARLDAEYYCFHHPEARVPGYRSICNCRKPKPGLILKAAEDLDLDLSSSYMVGDGLTDVIAGKAAGCRTIWIGKLKCDICKLMDLQGARPDMIVDNLLEATIKIEREIGVLRSVSLGREV